VAAAAPRSVRALPAPFAAGAVASAVGIAVGVSLAVDVRVGAALAFAALAVPVALVDPPLLLALWAALAVFSKWPGFGLALTATGVVALGSWLVHARADRARVGAALRRHRRLLVVLVLLLAWLTLSQVWAEDPARAAAGVLSWFVNAAALVALVTLVRTPRDVTLVVGAVVLAVVASVVLGLAGVDLSAAAAPDAGAGSDGRLQGASGDPNFMAAFIVAAVVLAAVLYGTVRSPGRAVLAAAIVVMVVGLAATQSRGGMLAMLVVLLVAFVAMPGRRLAVFGAGAAVLLVAVAWISVNPGVIERIKDAQQDRGNGREDLWLVASRMSADHPLTGVGLDNFIVRSPDYVRRPGAMSYVDLIVDRPHVVHNTYLQMLATTGAVGLALFLAVIAAALAAAIRAARRFERAGRRALGLLSRGVLVANIGVFTAAFFINVGDTAVVWVLIALGPALLSVAGAGDRARSGGIGSSSTRPRPSSAALVRG
jgi:O-antigen ligase